MTLSSFSLEKLLVRAGLTAAVFALYMSIRVRLALSKELKEAAEDRRDLERSRKHVLYLIKQLLPIVVLFVLPSLAGAVQISDTLLGADGTAATGILYVSWPSFIAASNQAIGQGNLNVRIQNGVLNLNLVATVGASAVAGSSLVPLYTVRFISTTASGASFTETWNVPVSNTPVTLVQIVCSGTVSCGGSGTVSSGTPSTTGYSDAEVPGGTINGTNLAFTLANAPLPVLSLQLMKNGMTLKQGGDYTLSGSTVTFVSGAVPLSGDALQCWYRYNNITGGSGFTYADAEVPGGTITGTNATFTLAYSPLGTSLQLYRNGLVQRVGVDYTISASTVTFLTGQIPQTGDLLQAWYRH